MGRHPAAPFAVTYSRGTAGGLAFRIRIPTEL